MNLLCLGSQDAAAVAATHGPRTGRLKAKPRPTRPGLSAAARPPKCQVRPPHAAAPPAGSGSGTNISSSVGTPRTGSQLRGPLSIEIMAWSSISYIGILNDIRPAPFHIDRPARRRLRAARQHAQAAVGLAHRGQRHPYLRTRGSKIHGWPTLWTNFTPLLWIFGQTTEPTCKFWANPVNFRLGSARRERDPCERR